MYKRQVLVSSRKEEDPVRITLGNNVLQAIKEYNYLGSKVTSDGRTNKEIIIRINQAKTAFKKQKNIFTLNSIRPKNKEEPSKDIRVECCPMRE